MMVGGAIAGLVALALLVLAVIVLIVTAFYNKRLAAIGFALLLIWVFTPPLWNIAKYNYAMWQSGYDHYRETEKIHFGVNLPDDHSFWRSKRDFLANPAYGLGFRTIVEGVDHEVGFAVSNTRSDLNFDFSGCSYADGPNGLRTVIMQSCDNPGHRTTDFVFTTQPDDPNPAILILHSFDKVEDIRIFRFVHGDATVSVFVGSDLRIGRPKLPQAGWMSIRAAVIPLLDAHFVFNPDP